MFVALMETPGSTDMWIDGCVSPIADQAYNDLRVAISWTESRSRKRHVGFSGNLKNSGHSGSDPEPVIPD